jgi:pyruvate dehydrogenase E1 component
MVARWVPGGLRTLGTDGFGRSDTRESLRRFFGVDAAHVSAAVLAELGRRGALPMEQAARRIEGLGLDPEAPFALNA